MMDDRVDERLHRYFDGELSDEERARVEAELSEDDQLKLAALAEIRGLTANALMAEAADVDLWAGLARQIDPATPATQARKPVARGWGWRAHRASWSAGAVAMAAAALLMVFQPWHGADNNCDIESLETAGNVATVFNMQDTPHGPTTVIWTEEQD